MTSCTGTIAHWEMRKSQIAPINIDSLRSWNSGLSRNQIIYRRNSL